MTRQESKTSWIGFKGPFYPTALNKYGDYYTIKTRFLEKYNDSFWQMDLVQSAENKQIRIPSEDNAKNYVASGIRIIKVSNEENNIFYEYAAPNPTQRFVRIIKYTDVFELIKMTPISMVLSSLLNSDYQLIREDRTVEIGVILINPNTSVYQYILQKLVFGKHRRKQRILLNM